MATANPLEDHITCSVCFDVFKDPHMLLGCLHTFCLECLQQLERTGQIQCPECRQNFQRKDMRKDFKTQSLMDAMNKPKTILQSKMVSAECGMCHIPNKQMKCHCTECNHFMCNGCQQIHAGMIVCKNHRVKPVPELMNTFESQLTEMIHKLAKERRNVHKKSNRLNKDIEQIEKSQVEQLDKVKEYTEGTIRDLKENEKLVGKIIKQANSTLIRNLKQMKQFYVKSHEDIQSKIDFLNDLIKGQDVKTLMESTENIKASVTESIAKIKASLPDIALEVKSPVNIKKGERLDIKHFIEVKVDDVPYGLQELKPFLQSLYSDLCNNDYTEYESVKLESCPLKLCKINDEIWCCRDNKITIFNQICEQVKEISLSQVSNIRAMALVPTVDICVASRGLHLLGTNGQYKARLDLNSSSFSDVCTYDSHVYALDCDRQQVLVFRYTNKWENIRVIDLTNKLQFKSSFDKVCVNKAGLYVSSEQYKCIYSYSMDGKLKQKITKGNNELHICDIDASGNLLVADYTGNQIKVYCNDGSWNTVPIGDLQGPIHALVDDWGNIWVADHINQTVTKFTQV